MQQLWFTIQVMALGSILFLGFMSSSGDSLKIKTTSANAPFLRAVSMRNPVGDPPQTITSRVVTLPIPGQLIHPLRLEIETRQLRFERSMNSLPKLRQPASTDAWVLSSIQRKVDADWEAVPLVGNDTQQVLGSVFVELADGENDFLVTFKDMQGKEVSYPVKVNHFKKSTT